MRSATPIPRQGLPASADLFIGRDGELAAVSALLADGRTRLVTLTGPPGIGKTRLAIACAAAHAERNRRAAAFVDLAPVREPAQVIAELARALAVEPRDGADVISQLAESLGHVDQLIVLDNFEHVLPAADELGQVLAACQRLTVLATSRERLRLAAEQELPVPPLAMPSQAELADLDSLASNPSVALLMDRAQRTNPGFALTTANAALLVNACVRLEGLPLAIELAAARLKVLTPGELVFRLGSRMDVLAGSTRDVPVRQRALRTAIEWSYDLLNRDERAMFRKLSVFVGTWSLADAEYVCAGSASDVLAAVESLLDKSLIRRVPADEETAEFSMLESLREFASHLLASSGEADELSARHAEYYARLAVQWEASIGSPDELIWWPRVGRYHADAQAALNYYLAAGQPELALPVAAALGWYHHTRGSLGHGLALVDHVLSAAGQLDQVGSEGGPGTEALDGVLISAGVLAFGTGDPERAEDLLLRVLEHAVRQGDVRRTAIVSAFLGHVARAGGQWDASQSWHQRAAGSFGQLGSTQSVAWAQHDLGLLARDRGDLADAVSKLRTSLRVFREMDYPWAVASAAWGLGTALCAQGAIDEARGLLGEALRIFRDLDDARGVAQCLEALAQIASERAHYETAARLIGAASAQRARLAASPADAEQARISAVESTLAQALGAEAAERLRQAGRTMPAQRAAELGTAVSSGAAPSDTDRDRPVALTRRELQVAALVASGRTNRQIGRVLGISEKTAEVHLQHVMSKLDARSRAEVAAWAVAHQISAPDGSA